MFHFAISFKLSLNVSFFQGERGAPGMPGYTGEPGEKVRRTLLKRYPPVSTEHLKTLCLYYREIPELWDQEDETDLKE